jgi:cobalt-zinc-cadmium efflux system outer membrane protein
MLGLALLAVGVSAAWADPPPEGVPEPQPEVLTREAAVVWALEHNPQLMVQRQQHGIAAAGIVIARTYPFNPIWEGKIREANGPASAGVTNVVSNEHKFLLELEIRGQGRYRRQGAYATLSRTDWEIAFQETSLGVRVVRAFNAQLFEQERVRLFEETVALNQKGADQVRRLAQQAKARPADLIVARSEVDDSNAQLGLSRAALVTARYDLRRALGAVCELVQVVGALEAPPGGGDLCELTQKALEKRADLRARQAAVAEAEALLRLTIANRYGNPNLGPAYEYDPTRINLIGAQITLPLPVFNTQRGQILQRAAERDRAVLDLRQTEVAVKQDVQAALARLAQALALLDTYRQQVLPHLQASLDDMNQLFEENEPGVDVLRVLDVRRKLIRARDGQLAALLEVNQARADLAAAVGDLTLAFGPCPPAPEAGPPLQP